MVLHLGMIEAAPFHVLQGGWRRRMFSQGGSFVHRRARTRAALFSQRQVISSFGRCRPALADPDLSAHARRPFSRPISCRRRGKLNQNPRSRPQLCS